MSSTGPQLSAHKGLRGEVLLELKRAQPLTAKQLAETLGVSPNAVRHHLKELEAESLIVYGREQRGVGAPTFAYRLSAAVEVFEDHYRELTRRVLAELGGAPAPERVALVARLMNEQGYMADWQAAAGQFRLAEHNCAIRAVAERFPEVCAAEERFLRDVLGAAVERLTHITSGCNACEYAITFAEPANPRREPGVTEQP